MIPSTLHSIADEALMARVAATLDDESFAELSLRYGARAYRVALALLGNREAAEDAVQESFLRLIRARASYRHGASFATWYYVILRNVCRDERRRRASATPQIALAEVSTPADPSELAERRESLEQAHRALAQLTWAEREALTLRIFGGLDFIAIAQACEISTDLAKKRVYRALDHMRQMVQPARLGAKFTVASQ